MINTHSGSGYLETVAETRFTDFPRHRYLHFSQSLMYFEKARFAVAKVSGICEVLNRLMPGAEIAFVVIRVRLTMHKPIYLNQNGDYPYLRVRTWLVPAFCRLSFRQQIVGASEDVLTEGFVDVAILVNGELMRHFPQEVRDCLDRYEKEISVRIAE